MAKFFYHVGYFIRSSFRAECNVVENPVVLSEAKSIEADLSVTLRFSRDDCYDKNKF